MILLYEHPLSPYAQKVKIALAEKGVEYELRLPDLLAGADASFTAANPRQEVPALVIDDRTAIFDSTIILEYIEDRWPSPPLLPPGPAERARARMIEEVCDTTYEAINWGVFEVHFFGRGKDKAEKLLARAEEQTRGLNTWLERQLGEATWLNGESFGWADLAAAPLVHAAAFTGRPPASGSRLEGWLERVRARPSVEQTFRAATESLGGFDQVGQLLASGIFKREYRDHRLEWMVRSGGLDVVVDGLANDNIRFSRELD
jgi:glutathione S-transferase/RNA polymerase-associated protein